MVSNSQDTNSNRYDYIMHLKLFFVNDFNTNTSFLIEKRIILSIPYFSTVTIF